MDASAWRKVILLGLGYFLVALIPAWLFGLKNIALLFPSAGIALGALLIFGSRLWLGVLFGCLLLGGFHITMIDSWNWASWLDVLINTVATLIAVMTGFWLMHRWISVRQLFKGEGRNILLLCLIAPFICALGAGFIFFAYWILDLADAGASLEVAFMWWLGDVTGILTITPAMLIFFSYRSQQKRQYRLKILLSLCIMVAFSFAVFAGIIDWEESLDKAAFMRAGDVATTSLQEHLEAHEEKQIALGQVLRFAPNLSEEDWNGIVTEWMKQHPGSAGFGHAVFVERSERASFVREIRQRGLPAFSIREFDQEGRLVLARDAADYLPYMHIAPLEGNRGFIGVNAYSGDTQHDQFLLEQVVYGKTKLVVRGVLPWMSTERKQEGLLLFKPLDSEKFTRPQGITVSGIFMDDLVDKVLGEDLRAAINICLTLPLPRGGRDRLYGEAGCEKEEWEKREANALVYRSSILLGGERLEVRALSAAAFHDPYLYPSCQYARQDGWHIYMLICLMVLLLAFFFIFYTTSIQGEKEINKENAHNLRRLKHELARQEKFLAMLEKAGNLGCWEQNADAFKGSEGLCRIFAIEPGALGDWRQLLLDMPAEGRARFMEALLRLEKHDGEEVFDVQLQDSEDSESEKACVRFYLDSYTEEDGKRHIHGVAEDVSEEARQDRRIQFLLRNDPVMKLGNSLSWDEQASEAVTNAEQRGEGVLTIFEIGLEDTEKLASSFGIAASRAVQREIGARIKKTVGEGRILSWHGNGFSCCAPDLKSISEAVNIAQEMLKAMKRTIFRFERQEIVLSINIGIAIFPEDGRTLDTLQRNAMTALRTACAVGLDNFKLYDPVMDRKSAERLALERALRLGIARNELVLHYQPLIDQESGKVHSCEALLRWNHPENGIIHPAEFIPLAEETGLILPLGQWVFSEVCRQQVRWKDYGLKISANVSAMRFSREHFVDNVASSLVETGADPKRIVLEIMESTLMNMDSRLWEQIYRLKSIGFELFIDDFGTGYSSLFYLKRLPISGLKLSRTVIADLLHDADSRAVVSTALMMAREMGMTVVAKGVETGAQVEFLRELNCDILQGYYFSKPLEAAEFEQWLQKYGAAGAAHGD